MPKRKEKKNNNNYIDNENVIKKVNSESNKIDNIDGSQDIKNDDIKLANTSVSSKIEEGAQKLHKQMDQYMPNKSDANYRNLMQALSMVCFIKHCGTNEEFMKRLNNLEKSCEAYKEKHPLTIIFTKTYNRKNVVRDIIEFCKDSKIEAVRSYSEFKSVNEGLQNKLRQRNNDLERTSYTKEVEKDTGKLLGNMTEKIQNNVKDKMGYVK